MPVLWVEVGVMSKTKADWNGWTFGAFWEAFYLHAGVAKWTVSAAAEQLGEA